MDLIETRKKGVDTIVKALEEFYRIYVEACKDNIILSATASIVLPRHEFTNELVEWIKKIASPYIKESEIALDIAVKVKGKEVNVIKDYVEKTKQVIEKIKEVA